MYDNILVPTDGSDHAVRAAEHGMVLARAFDAAVHVLTVVDGRGAAGPPAPGGDGASVADREFDGERAVETVEDVVEEAPTVRTAILRGDPAETILDYATDHGVGVIAMGTHGRTGLNRYIAGSVTERVVRRADVPVLTVRATAPRGITEGYDEILVPTDGSDHADAAVDHALSVARTFDARVHAVNVVNVADLAVDHSFTPPTELVENLRASGTEATEAVAARARAAGLDAETSVVEGVPAPDLIAYADDNDVDLIAMGTAGRSGLERVLLGSTTERLIRHGAVPVLAVRPSGGQ